MCVLSFILQQTAVMGELQSYLHPANGIRPHDYDSVSPCLKYLQACNKIFENGFLSHDRITTPQSPVLGNIHNGYQFFVDWFDTLDGM